MKLINSFIDFVERNGKAYFSKDEIKELRSQLDDYKGSRPQKPPMEKPKEKITNEMLLKVKKGKRCETLTNDGVLWVVNPATKKWVKDESSVGKVINTYCK